MGPRVIVCFPRIEVSGAAEWKRVMELRDRWDPIAAKIAAHLTLVFPFEDVISDRELALHMASALEGARSFGIHLRGVTAHESEYLFLNVKRGNDELIELHDRLYTGPLARHLLRTHTFLPHVTVGRAHGEELSAALEASGSIDSVITGVIEQVAVYRIEGDGIRNIAIEHTLVDR